MGTNSRCPRLPSAGLDDDHGAEDADEERRSRGVVRVGGGGDGDGGARGAGRVGRRRRHGGPGRGRRGGGGVVVAGGGHVGQGLGRDRRLGAHGDCDGGVDLLGLGHRDHLGHGLGGRVGDVDGVCLRDAGGAALDDRGLDGAMVRTGCAGCQKHALSASLT